MAKRWVLGAALSLALSLTLFGCVSTQRPSQTSKQSDEQEPKQEKAEKEKQTESVSAQEQTPPPDLPEEAPDLPEEGEMDDGEVIEIE